MKTIKEKPKEAKSKKNRKKSVGRSQPAISAKQATKLMKDKYVQQLDRQQSEASSTEAQATEQVERAGTWAAGEVILHERPHFPCQRSEKIKERPQGTPESTEPPTPIAPAEKPAGRSFMAGNGTPSQEIISRTVHESAEPPKVPSAGRPDTASLANSPKRATQIKERSTKKIKEREGQIVAPSIKQHPAPPSESIVSIKSIYTPKQQTVPATEQPAVHSPAPGQRIEGLRAQHQGYDAPTPPQRTLDIGQSIPPASATSVRCSTPATQKASQPIPNQPRSGHILSERKKLMPQQAIQSASATSAPTHAGPQLPKAQGNARSAAPKTKGAFYLKEISRPKLSKSQRKNIVSKAPRAARQTTQQRMVQRAVQQVRNTVRAPAAVLKQTAAVVTRAAAALINTVAVLVGGGILLLALVAVVIVAAVANSPFGLFFAQEPNASGTVSVARAVGTVNMAYNSRLELLQSGDYDDIVVQGQAADWADVLAVFAVQTAGADVGGLDVATLDTDRVAKLTAVFWDMIAISVSEETIDHPAAGSTEAWTETILHLTITPKTADDMRTAYAFSAYQNSALDELLSDRPVLAALAGSLTITSADVRDVLAALPDDLAQARQDTVQTALQLVGKVTYFWGGKSRVIGWDYRWGQLKKVTAAGNSTSGTYRPFGLDCSGFVDWTFNNSLGYIIGHGGGARAQHTYCTNISQSEAQPGDLAFYPDDSHVGIIVGRNAVGKLLVCHCSSGSNNVVVTEFTASGFTTVGRPDIFGP